MIVPVIIIALAILVGLWYLKIEHYAQRIKIVVLIIIGFLIYFSVSSVLSSEKLDITSPQGIFNAAYVYFGWAKQTAVNLWNIGTDTVKLVGNAIKVNNSDGRPKR